MANFHKKFEFVYMGFNCSVETEPYGDDDTLTWCYIEQGGIRTQLKTPNYGDHVQMIKDHIDNM